jgi:hypothetical protein
MIISSSVQTAEWPRRPSSGAADTSRQPDEWPSSGASTATTLVGEEVDVVAGSVLGGVGIEMLGAVAGRTIAVVVGAEAGALSSPEHAPIVAATATARTMCSRSERYLGAVGRRLDAPPQ